MHGIDLDPEQKHTHFIVILWLRCAQQLCVIMIMIVNWRQAV